MIRILLTSVILLFGLFDTASGQDFSGQVYLMTESSPVDNCEPPDAVDCSTSDIVFLSESKFVMIHRCMPTDSYYKGTYKVTKGHLTMKFEQFVIHEISPTNKIEKIGQTVSSATFNIKMCKADTPALQRTDLKVLTRAFKMSQEQADKTIEKLRKSSAWGRLQ